MSDRATYQVQVLDGYTDGRPSWMRVSSKSTREAAELARDDIQKVYPSRKYRIRQIRRRS